MFPNNLRNTGKRYHHPAQCLERMTERIFLKMHREKNLLSKDPSQGCRCTDWSAPGLDGDTTLWDVEAVVATHPQRWQHF